MRWKAVHPALESLLGMIALASCTNFSSGFAPVDGRLSRLANAFAELTLAI